MPTNQQNLDPNDDELYRFDPEVEKYWMR